MGSETQDTSSLLDITDPFHGLSFQVGVAENKNPTYRAKMEDVHTYVANFAEKPDWGYFAIFDGHAGKQTARWCGNNLHTLLEEEMLAMEALLSPLLLLSAPLTKLFSLTNSQPSEDNKDVRDALNRVFVKADELIEQEGSGSSGCTAAVAVLRWEGNLKETEEATIKGLLASKPFDFVPSENHKRMLYTANVGDLRIVLCRGNRLYRLTYDHKASDAKEISRIRDAGGLVVKNRVNGVLAITRSLGDSYVKNLVTGRPFTTATEITKEDEFLILACDGVWDVITDDLACKFVQDIFRAQREKKQQEDPGYAAKKLCQYAIEKATTDNVTVMVVKLDPQVFPQRDN
ncbi:CIC11C00000002231 [Sungouiella intermedia]|uniref:CIC11C00000002231 n=1 Tax=Sungouiella intermedia TaxID=45354 RepID=A0A1L0BFA0_9ASCO|nr:CIC11C00000002231 [[Candida] intermedia]